MQISDLMHEYFADSATTGMLIESSDLNVESGWRIVSSPERLMKDYRFASRGQAIEFVRQIFLYEDAVAHHGKITIEGTDVRLEVYTHDLEKVTELDYEYADFADDVSVDVGGI